MEPFLQVPAVGVEQAQASAMRRRSPSFANSSADKREKICVPDAGEQSDRQPGRAPDDPELRHRT